MLVEYFFPKFTVLVHQVLAMSLTSLTIFIVFAFHLIIFILKSTEKSNLT